MEIIKSTVNFLLITAAVHGFVFVLLPLLNKKKISFVIICLNFSVLFISLNNLQAWLIDKKFGLDHYVWRNLEIPWYLLVTPFFYAFLIRFMKIEDQTQQFLKIAIWVFLIEVIFRTVLIYFGVSSGNNLSLKRYTKFEESVNAAFSIIIFIQALRILFFKTELHSHVKRFGELQWLRIFMIIGCVVMAAWIAAIVISYFTDYQHGVLAYYPLRLASSFLIYWIGYQGLIKYNLIQDRLALKSELKDEIVEITKIPPSRPKRKDTSEEFKKIEGFILKDQSFLDPDLSLEALADKININKGQLSKAINEQSGYNFTDFINQYRVGFAKNLLTDKDFDDYTNIAIGLESGFNSKSTFYAAFKKFTGISPSDYRKKS